VGGMKKIYLILLIILMIIPFVSASQNVFKLNDPISYIFPCFINGTLCDFCNTTIFDDNLNIKIDGVTASKHGSFFKVDIAEELVNTTGTWKVLNLCNSSKTQEIGIDYFLVSPDGKTLSTAQGLIYAILPVFSLFILIILLFWLAFNLGDKYAFSNFDVKTSNYIRTLFVWIGLFLIPLLIGLISKISNNVFGENSYIANAFYIIQVTSMILIGVIFFLAGLFFLMGIISQGLGSMIRRRR